MQIQECSKRDLGGKYERGPVGGITQHSLCRCSQTKTPLKRSFDFKF